MRFFISGELDLGIHEFYAPVRKKVESILNEKLAEASYGGNIDKIALIPIILGPRFHAPKERRLVSKKQRFTDYRLIIDYERFKAGTETERIALLVENLITSVTDINRKLKGVFDGERLCSDIRSLFNHFEFGEC